MQGRDFIIVGLQPWDIAIGSNCKNIALEIARQNRVLYVNRPLDRSTLLRHRHHEHTKKRRAVLAGQSDDLYQPHPDLWVLNPRTVLESINWLRWPTLYHYLNRVNTGRIVSQINSAIQRLGFSKVIVLNDNDFLHYLYLPELLQPDQYIYYIRDFLTSQPYFSPHGTLEGQLIRKADVVIANSQYLSDYGATYNPHSFFVGQGCDFSWLEAESPVPEDIRSIPSPRIGYAGALLANRLDLAMIAHGAQALPHYSFVLVGPEDDAFAKSRLHQLPNVFFLGAKPVEAIPRYIRQFDVCINPQWVNDLTVGNYPRKIDEYLGLGKPVVATATEAMNYFAEHVYLAHDQVEFGTLLQHALAEDQSEVRERRKAFALSHTWEHCTEQIYQAITSLTPD